MKHYAPFHSRNETITVKRNVPMWKIILVDYFIQVKLFFFLTMGSPLELFPNISGPAIETPVHGTCFGQYTRVREWHWISAVTHPLGREPLGRAQPAPPSIAALLRWSPFVGTGTPEITWTWVRGPHFEIPNDEEKNPMGERLQREDDPAGQREEQRV